MNSGLHAEVHYLNEYLALRGSQRWLQLAVNRCPNVLDEAVAKAIDLDQGETIEWVSPLESGLIYRIQGTRHFWNVSA